MPSLEFYPIGANPAVEAVRIQTLCSDSGVDRAVTDEFAATIQAYQQLGIPEITARIAQKYTGNEPPVVGVIPVANQDDIGMAIWGEKIFQTKDELEPITGINVSAWLLRQFRSQGYGTQIIRHGTQTALERVNDPIKPSWNGMPVWTSVHRDNTASRRACSKVGFTEAGPQKDADERLIYVLDELRPIS